MNEEKGFLYRFGKGQRSIIAFMVTALSFAFLFALMFVEIPVRNESIINVASGIVLGVLGTVCAYYFGSSKDQSDTTKVTNAAQASDNNNPL